MRSSPTRAPSLAATSYATVLRRRWLLGATSLVLTACSSRVVLAQSADRLLQRIDAVVDSAYKANEPGGVLLVAKGERILHHRAFGMANMEWGVPMTTDAVFSIGSITKQFTAVAVLQLIERGRLSLTDTVGKFLPGYPAALRGISVQQLLTHTSGLANAKSVASLMAVGRGWLGAEQVMATFKDQPLEFAPGTRWSYSNSGYQLLGYIIEKVTGEPLPEYVEKTVLTPAGMTHSLWGNDMRVVRKRAVPYLHTRNGVENAVNGNVQMAWAAGAIQATTEDLFKWQRALLSGVFVRDSTLRHAWTASHTADGEMTDYGFGWFVGEFQGSRLVEHSGNMGGFMSHVMYFPREQLFVALLLNGRGNRLPELVATEVAALALGRPLRLKAAVLPDDTLRAYAGRYKDRWQAEVRITLEDGKLFYQKTGGQKWRLVPYAIDRVFFDNTATIGEFRRDTSNRILGFDMQTQRGQSKNRIERAEGVPR